MTFELDSFDQQNAIRTESGPSKSGIGMMEHVYIEIDVTSHGIIVAHILKLYIQIISYCTIRDHLEKNNISLQGHFGCFLFP